MSSKNLTARALDTLVPLALSVPQNNRTDLELFESFLERGTVQEASLRGPYTKQELVELFVTKEVVPKGFFGRLKAEIIIRLGVADDIVGLCFDRTENGMFVLVAYPTGTF